MGPTGIPNKRHGIILASLFGRENIFHSNQVLNLTQIIITVMVVIIIYECILRYSQIMGKVMMVCAVRIISTGHIENKRAEWGFSALKVSQEIHVKENT